MPTSQDPATNAGNKTGRPSGGVERMFAVLRALRKSPVALSLTAIAKEAQIAQSTAHALLSELHAAGAVTLDENKRYQLGPSLFYLGSAYARTTPVFRSLWIELVDLANELQVSAALAVPWQAHHLIVAAHRGGDSVNVALGGIVPLEGGSWGKVYYAVTKETPPPSFVGYTDATITDPNEYARNIEAVRTVGYATDTGEFADSVCAVATAVTSDRGYEGLASLMWSLTKDLEPQYAGRRLTGLAARASLSLGDPQRLIAVGSD